MSSPSSSAVDDPRVVVQIPCLSDNYGYLLHDPSTGCTAAVDTPDAAAYRSELDRRGWSLTHVLNTHHHWDHTGGNLELKAEYSKGGETGGVTVIGPESERGKIPGIDVGVSHGDVVKVGSFEADVLDVGGHTSGHVAFHFKGSSGQQSGGQKDGEGGPLPSIVFTGDSLFALGCGKMFEGDQDQFWDSLLRLRELPDDTVVYCGHEYTESNAAFALSVEPSNPKLVQRVQEIKTLRSQSLPTVPSILGLEKLTNPFLRGDLSKEIRDNVGSRGEGESGAEVFGKIRKAKDKFRGSL